MGFAQAGAGEQVFGVGDDDAPEHIYGQLRQIRFQHRFA